MSELIGAELLNVITMSLYDKPIVVFREYVQNSVDSIFSTSDPDKHSINIFKVQNSLFFLDDGEGIASENFLKRMTSLFKSTKKRKENLGYKGIGRLSGLPYCKKLYFVNVLNANESKYQVFVVDRNKYMEEKEKESYSELSFEKLINKIGKEEDFSSVKIVKEGIEKFKSTYIDAATGFLVILEEISQLLLTTIMADDFKNQLGWLLPLQFKDELLTGECKGLFNDLITPNSKGYTPVKSCKIYYENEQLYRPISANMMRDVVCKRNFSDYAVGFFCFDRHGISIDSANNFSGIRIYQDNMLLCDESELLQNLNNYTPLEHSTNGQLQTVRGIGMMLYITDKVNIVTNARRTFIEVDDASIPFLKLVTDFINDLYSTRYALSNYYSFLEKNEKNEEKLVRLRDKLIECLRILTREKTELDDSEDYYRELSDDEKKRVIMKLIRTQLNPKINEYISQLCLPSSVDDTSNIFSDFMNWVDAQRRNDV